MSTSVSQLCAGLVDDASVLPPSTLDLTDAAHGYRRHAAAWYADLLGVLLVPSSLLTTAAQVPDLPVGVVGDTGVDALPAAVAQLRTAGARVRRVEVPVARRGEDPQPGLAALRRFASDDTDLDVYAEIPLSWGLLAALDTVAEQRGTGLRVAAKFRVGGLAAELFPTPVELAAVVCACRDRELPFRLAAGLRRAVRHTDPETGFSHHGFLNILVAVLAADGGAEVAEVAEVLAATHPLPLVEPARVHRDRPRPLWTGFGAAAVTEPVAELVRLGLFGDGPN